MIPQLFMLAGLLALTSCQTGPPAHLDIGFAADTPVHRAVLQYRPNPEAAPVHAEAAVRFEAPSRFELVAWKGPEAWVTVQMDASTWCVEFPTQRRRFTGGDPHRAPAPIQVWLALRESFVKDAPSFPSAVAVTRNGATLRIQFPARR